MFQLFRCLEDRCFDLSKAILFIMMISITATTVGRYFFNSPIGGIPELVSQYLMVGMIFLSAAWLQREGGNVRMTAFDDYLPRPLRNIALIVSYTILVSILFYITRAFMVNAWERYLSWATTTGAIRLPTFITWTLGGIGLLLLIIRLSIEIYETIEALFNEYIDGKLMAKW